MPRHSTGFVAFFLLVSSVGFAAVCDPLTQPSGLKVSDGFVEFIPSTILSPFKSALPQIADADSDARMRAPETMWYDERSMVFMYQDSIETVVGGRANCVGRTVGETNPDNPGIHKLVNYFGPDYRFRFPFRKAAGTDLVENVAVLNFWSPPKRNGRAMPVKWWRQSSRGRWSWIFPNGTLFGEVLYQKSPEGKWIPFEIRTRKRHSGGWAVDMFRPFASAQKLADEVKKRRPNWQQSGDLKNFVAHLLDKNTLAAHRLESPAFGKVFPPVVGALDRLPAVADTKLITELLTTMPFVSMEGAIWKENGKLETYGPSSNADFSIVPKGYEMGMYPVNEVSCNRCHSETGRNLGQFEFDIILYGEVWGEDRIFTWHLFEPHERIFATWDDNDVSRKLNPRMAAANLLRNERPSSSDPDYKALASPFVPDSRSQRYFREEGMTR